MKWKRLSKRYSFCTELGNFFSFKKTLFSSYQRIQSPLKLSLVLE